MTCSMHTDAAGKSQIMKCAARLSQRSVMMTGMGSSAAGLTAAAIKTGGQVRKKVAPISTLNTRNFHTCL